MTVYVARTVVGAVFAALAVYVITGVGLAGPRALAANHALATEALNGFMHMGERYFQAHPIVPPPPAAPPQSPPGFRP